MFVLAAAARKLHCAPTFVAFSRANYKFAYVQPDVHRSFDAEVLYLQQFFPTGQAYILGPLNGPRWHVFLATVGDAACPPASGREQTFEVIMTDLHVDAMAAFYRRTDDPAAEHYTAAVATAQTGIDQLLPGAIVDAFLFEPCGYSCNAVRGAEYFTIHVTPEPHCSFVSFETNAVLESYDALLAKVLAIFRPGQFSVSVFVDNGSALGNSQLALTWDCAEYARDDACYHEFASGCNLAYGNFARAEETPLPPRARDKSALVVRVLPESKLTEWLTADDCKTNFERVCPTAAVSEFLERLGLDDAIPVR